MYIVYFVYVCVVCFYYCLYWSTVNNRTLIRPAVECAELLPAESFILESSFA